ncbi:hypothetical protein ABT236_32285 [Streptomyces sp. NPDC001523]|uniref:hypothetical protein n=1 Tax=Streptomyces sp. NPDC001523 TaxID=3154383 RepID=UPI00332BBDEB
MPRLFAARADHQVLAERMEQERAAGVSRGRQWAREAEVVLDQAVAHLTKAFEKRAGHGKPTRRPSRPGR